MRGMGVRSGAGRSISIARFNSPRETVRQSRDEYDNDERNKMNEGRMRDRYERKCVKKG